MASQSKFYRVYKSCVIAFAVLLLLALVVFYFWLRSYENSQPEHAANKIVTNYLQKGNVYGIKDICKLDVSKYDSKENVNKSFAAQIKGKTLTVATSTKKSDDSDITYAVSAGDKKVMYLYLNRNKKKSFGNRGYTVKKAEFDKSMYKTIYINMPQDAEVKINGITVSDSEKTDTKLPNLSSTKLDKSKIINKQQCKIDNILTDEVKITAKTGDTELQVEHSGNSYSVKQLIDSAQAKKITDYAVEASKAYAAYMQNDNSFGNVAKYLDSSTEFYNNLRTSLVIFAWDHNGYRFEDVVSSELHKYSDNLFSCRVKLKQVLILGSSTYSDISDKYVYLKKTKNGYAVIDMQSAEG